MNSNDLKDDKILDEALAHTGKSGDSDRIFCIKLLINKKKKVEFR